jgi:hypothetical protein
MTFGRIISLWAAVCLPFVLQLFDETEGACLVGNYAKLCGPANR